MIGIDPDSLTQAAHLALEIIGLASVVAAHVLTPPAAGSKWRPLYDAWQVVAQNVRHARNADADRDLSGNYRKFPEISANPALPAPAAGPLQPPPTERTSPMSIAQDFERGAIAVLRTAAANSASPVVGEILALVTAAEAPTLPNILAAITAVEQLGEQIIALKAQIAIASPTAEQPAA